MAEVGYASLGIIPSFKGFGSELERGSSKAMATAGVSGGQTFGSAAGKSAGSRFGSVFKTAAKASLVGLAGLGALAVTIGKDAVVAASDLEESTNKVKQVFGSGSRDVLRFSERASKSLGQTNQQARDAAATFGIFGKVAKLTGRENAKFATGLTTLASDLASFSNTTPEEAIEAIGAALRGEAEPIRKYGVLLDEATLKAEALALGLLKPVKDKAKIQAYQVAILDGQKKYNEAVKEYGEDSLEALKAEANLGTSRDRLKKATEGTIPTLTAQQKVLAAQSAIYKQTSDAQGDFTRTSHGLANQQRILKARWEDAKAALGKALLPVVNDAVKFLNKKGIPAFERFAEWFNQEGIDHLKDFGGKLKTIAGHAKDVAKFLNDLPKPAKIAALTALLAGVGGVTALKVRGGRGGALGGLGSALGLAKPVPVFVTNPGFGGGTPGTPGKPTPGGVANKVGKVGGPVALFATLGAVLENEHPLTMPKMAERSAKFLREQFEDTKEGADDARGSIQTFTSKIVDDLYPALFGTGVRLDRTRGKTDDLNGVLDLVPRSKATEFHTPGLPEALSNAQQYRKALDRINALSLVEASPFGFLTGKREHGGPVQAGRAYLVGERRPEVFVPNTGGRIEPDARAFAGGSGNHFHGGITVYADTYEDMMRKIHQRKRRAADGVGR